MSKFYYSDVQSLTGKPGLLPFIEVTLFYAVDSRQIKELTVPALVDSGSTVNVLPCDIGERFGLNWQEQRDMLRPGGVVFGRPSLALPLWGKVSGFQPVQMPFAWSEIPSTQLRVLLGQVNFFDEFFVDFRKPLGYFDVVLKDG